MVETKPPAESLAQPLEAEAGLPGQHLPRLRREQSQTGHHQLLPSTLCIVSHSTSFVGFLAPHRVTSESEGLGGTQ